MSRLEDLIKKLCPNGVEFKTLGELGTFVRGNGLQKQDFVESGVPCIHYGQMHTHYGTFADRTISFVTPEVADKLKKAQKGDLIIVCTSEDVDEVCKCMAWLGDEDVCVGGETYIFKHNQDPKYLAYYFQTNAFSKFKRRKYTGTKVIRVHENALRDFQIPVPPLEVQQEIARILDKFATLEAELEAELEARKKQYQFYREQLLESNENAELKKLGEMIIHGEKVQINKSIAQETGKYPVINSSREALGYCDTYNNDGNSIVLTSHGAYAGYTHWLKSPFLAGALCYPMRSRDENELLSKFIYYWLQNEEEIIRQKFVNRSGVPYVNARAFFDSQIPVPPLSEQKRIVEILDKFSTLIDDISSGLPAEIKMRHQQYEYYRDKLLTFTQAA